MSMLPWQERPAELRVDSLESWQGQEDTPGRLAFSGVCPRCGHSFTRPVDASAVIVTAAAEGGTRFDAATFFQCV